MSITHAKTSSKSDGADATLVQPSDWNAGHTITAIVPSAADTYALGAAGTAWTTVYTAGISFPATQVASADANTLDDYEEGTWTPTLTFETVGNLSATYTTQTGVYTKVGRLMTISASVVMATWAHTTASGALRMGGLPAGLRPAQEEAFTVIFGNLAVDAAEGQVGAYCLGSASEWIYFLQSGIGSGWVALDTTHAPNLSLVQLKVSGSYRV